MLECLNNVVLFNMVYQFNKCDVPFIDLQLDKAVSMNITEFPAHQET